MQGPPVTPPASPSRTAEKKIENPETLRLNEQASQTFRFLGTQYILIRYDSIQKVVTALNTTNEKKVFRIKNLTAYALKKRLMIQVFNCLTLAQLLNLKDPKDSLRKDSLCLSFSCTSKPVIKIEGTRTIFIKATNPKEAIAYKVYEKTGVKVPETYLCEDINALETALNKEKLSEEDKQSFLKKAKKTKCFLVLEEAVGLTGFGHDSVCGLEKDDLYWENITDQLALEAIIALILQTEDTLPYTDQDKNQEFTPRKPLTDQEREKAQKLKNTEEELQREAGIELKKGEPICFRHAQFAHTSNCFLNQTTGKITFIDLDQKKESEQERFTSCLNALTNPITQNAMIKLLALQIQQFTQEYLATKRPDAIQRPKIEEQLKAHLENLRKFQENNKELYNTLTKNWDPPKLALLRRP